MGTISSAAIRRFRNRGRMDFRPWKKFSEDQLLDIRDRLPVRPPVWNVLRRHQKVCLLIGALHRYFGFFLDTGMGKTFLVIALIRYFKKRNPGKRRRFLVLVPNKTNKKEWSNQIKKHADGKLTITRMIGSSEQKWKTLLANQDADVVVETYGGLVRMVSKMTEVGKKKKTRLVWNPSLMKKLSAQFDGLILDESIKVMNKSSLISRVVYQLRKSAVYCFALNGTPFGKDPYPIWGQVYLLDLGKTLGETFGLFRSAFYTEKADFWGRKEYKFDKSKERMLHDFIAARTISYEADEGDLPAVVKIVKKINLPVDAETYAGNAANAIMSAKGNYIESKNAWMRMRQISSGWLGYKDDETGERASINFKPNLKLEYLLDFIESINPKYKWIVYHEFNYSGALISAALKQLGVKHAWVYGKSKDPEAEYERFVSTNAEKCPGLLLSNSAGAGLNLQVAKYGIYYESPTSPITRYQTRKRYQRQESPHKSVFQVDLVVAGTADESILRAHADGKDLFDAIIRGRFKRRGGLFLPETD